MTTLRKNLYVQLKNDEYAKANYNSGNHYFYFLRTC